MLVLAVAMTGAAAAVVAELGCRAVVAGAVAGAAAVTMAVAVTANLAGYGCIELGSGGGGGGRC